MSTLPSSFDAKSSQTGNCLSFGLLHIIDACSARPLLQAGPQPRKLVARALGQHFHAAVGVVAYPSGDAKNVRFALYKPAESDTLDTSTNYKPPGFGRQLLVRWSYPTNVILSAVAGFASARQSLALESIRMQWTKIRILRASDR